MPSNDWIEAEEMGEDSGPQESTSASGEECEMLRAQLVMLNGQLFSQRKAMVEERQQTGESFKKRLQQFFQELYLYHACSIFCRHLSSHLLVNAFN